VDPQSRLKRKRNKTKQTKNPPNEFNSESAEGDWTLFFCPVFHNIDEIIHRETLIPVKPFPSSLAHMLEFLSRKNRFLYFDSRKEFLGGHCILLCNGLHEVTISGQGNNAFHLRPPLLKKLSLALIQNLLVSFFSSHFLKIKLKKGLRNKWHHTFDHTYRTIHYDNDKTDDLLVMTFMSPFILD